MTDHVNSMASNLTSQVRGIARVVTGVANGNLKQKLAVEAKGEIAELANTINEMIDTLAIFADQVTSVAREVGIEGKLGGQARVPGAAGIWRDLTDNVNQLTATLTTQVRAIAEVATAVTKGDLSRSITVQAQGEVAALKDNINEMIFNLKDTTRKNTETDWLKTNLAKFTRMLQGQRNLIAVAQMILSELARVVDAQHGVFYVMENPSGEDAELKMLASYAYKRRRGVPSHFRMGEGLVGQCAVEKSRILLTDVPGNYIQISSGLGAAPPSNIIVLPVLFEGEVKAVIELASFNGLSDIHLTFLEQLTEGIGIVLNTLSAIMRTEELLKQSQTLTQELQTQQEELKKTNERLEQQAATLRQSEELLRAQQEELRTTNEQLEEKARLLAEQKAEVEAKNREVEVAKEALEDKAEQLALTSKYKSQFLANMSHELRTPLNSLLILARLLADNEQGNLTQKQVEFARTIYAAGSDLLALINEILDLSKIESGTMAVDLGFVPFTEMKDYVESSFRQFAAEKGLEFKVELSPDLPAQVETDAKRLQQVIKNLLSNAFKFTSHGSVTLKMSVARTGWTPGRTNLDQAPSVIAVAVTDTGIGIPADKQRIIFEAFQQADMTTSRKFGGTGLGLSISREIATLLGGELRVDSIPGAGSTFTLYLPQPCPGSLTSPPVARVTMVPSAPKLLTDATQTPPPEAAVIASLEDDRESLYPGDRVLLMIEDDPVFARILLDMARERGFKGLIAQRGDQGVALARRYQPDWITLDVQLPDLSGWIVLDQLKQDATTRQIPVHVISATDGGAEKALRLGAHAVLEKPISAEALEAALTSMQVRLDQRTRRVLVVEDDEVQRENTIKMVEARDVETVGVGSGAEALEVLATVQFDCVILDLGLPDMGGAELAEKIRGEAGLTSLPIIVYTSSELSDREEADLRKMSETIIVKDVRSTERLLDEMALFLNRARPREVPARAPRVPTDRELAGRRVLVVDDDVRNIFALTSVLERQQMEVRHATNGLEAIQLLKASPDVDVVLMDIMMPGMDGYDTMRAIRRLPEFKTIPIIALTAKAMKGDREKCLDAGASDYVPKPVDTEQLLSLLRVWLEV
jgi:CheY-like chemotaxis protein/signal transduction histidine kinase/HAMP domain-containing protein